MSPRRHVPSVDAKQLDDIGGRVEWVGERSAAVERQCRPEFRVGERQEAVSGGSRPAVERRQPEDGAAVFVG
jgi:hypothetical protein